MSRVAHVVRRARADDPHTLGVVGLAEAMRASGGAGVFALEGATDVEGVQPFAELPAAATVLVYHQRGAAPALVRRLIEHGAPIAVVVDDAGIDPISLRDLRALAAAGATALVANERVAEMLAAMNFGRARTVPALVARNRLLAVGAYEPTAHHLDVSLHAPLVLTVDDVVTATNGARVVQAHHVLRTYLGCHPHLAVGVSETTDTDEGAVRTLFREIWGLRLTDTWAQRLRGHGERAALLRRAAVFVTAAPASGDVRHALAAMAEGVPVVAPADAAAREILGDGALLLPADASARLLAEAVAELLADDATRAFFSIAGSRAVARFDPAVVAPVWCEALAS